MQPWLYPTVWVSLHSMHRRSGDMRRPLQCTLGATDHGGWFPLLQVHESRIQAVALATHNSAKASCVAASLV